MSRRWSKSDDDLNNVQEINVRRSLSRSAIEISSVETNQEKEIEEPAVREAADLLWDNSADLESPLKEERSFDLSDLFEDPESFRTPSETDINTSENHAPVFDKTRAAAEERSEATVLDEVEEDSDSEAMDAEDYNQRNGALERQVRAARREIGNYTKEDVMLIDKVTYSDNLADTRNKITEVIEEIDAFMDELEATDDAERKTKWSNEMKNLLQEVKANEREVKQAMTDLLLDNPNDVEVIFRAAAGAGVAQGQVGPLREEHRPAVRDVERDQLRLDQEFQREIAKVNQKRLIINEKADEIVNLMKNVSRIGGNADDGKTFAEVMSDDQVRENLRESMSWKKKLEALFDEKNSMLIEAAGLPPQELENDGMKEKVENAKKKVNDVIKELKKVDQARGLYTLSSNKSKDTVEFPHFSGKSVDNIFEFTEKFNKALISNQVAEEDKVSKLIKCLSGEAKTKVGNHYKDVKVALKELGSYFGNPHLIWNAELEKIKAEHIQNHAQTWGRPGTTKWVMAIASLQEFVRKAENLAEKFDTLKPSIYNPATTSILFKCLPFAFRRPFLETIDDLNTPDVTKISKLKTLLEEEKTRAQLTCQMMLDNVEKETPVRRSSNYGRDRNDRNNTRQDKHSCYEDDACEVKWFGLGCKKLVEVAKVEERRDILQGRLMCKKCGFWWKNRNEPNKPHECRWEGFKAKAKCTHDGCPWGAVVCQDHKPGNLSQEVQNWLKRIGVKYIANVYIGPVNQEDLEVKIKEVMDKVNIKVKESEAVFDKAAKDERKLEVNVNEREALQDGNFAKFLTNDQIKEFFEMDLKIQQNIKDPVVHNIPEGDCLFIFTTVEGKTRDLSVFVDSGCNLWLCRKGVPEKELIAAKICNGPIPLHVAGGLQIQSEAEWSAVLPLADGSFQPVRGLVLNEITGEMPQIDLSEVVKQVKKELGSKASHIKLPNSVGGVVDMILGLQYAKIYPKPIHTFENGLTLFETMLKQKSGKNGCLGGPMGAFDNLSNNIGICETMKWMCAKVRNCKSFKPDTSFFRVCEKREELSIKFAVSDGVPGVMELVELEHEEYAERHEETVTKNEELFEAQADEKIFETPSKKEENKDIFEAPTNEKNEKKAEDVENLQNEKNSEVFCKCEGFTIQSEFKKFMELQNAGLSTEYKCTRCRKCLDCLRGAMYEKVSIRQEQEQQIIKDSVWIEWKERRAMAFLALRADPKDFLNENRFIAKKRLENVCKRYNKDKKVIENIMAAFKKLHDRGYLLYMEDLTEFQRKKLEDETLKHFIPWDIAFNPRSLSTPARPVFDASSNTPNGGTNLNDLCVKGTPQLINIVTLILGWLAGPVAITGDASSFYNCIGLHEDHWTYQRILIRDQLDPGNKVVEAFIRTLIYGVTCVSAQSEEIISMLAEELWEKFPEVAVFLVFHRYVDDFGKAVETKEKAKELIEKTEEALDKISLKIKGWSESFKPPEEKLTEDGVSVSFAGLVWYPEVDTFKLYIQPTHFERKKRGKYPDDMKVFDGKFGTKMESFVPETLSLRNCTSVTARFFDPVGKNAPLQMKLKYDIRKILKIDASWDKPIPGYLRETWIQNFKIIEEVRDFEFVRCPIPKGAVNIKKMRIWLLTDAAEGIIMPAYAGYEMPDGSWSCSHIFAKNALPPEGWTTPMRELQGVSGAANIKVILEKALEGWIEVILVGSDSEIALMWTSYEHLKLEVFQRNRAINTRMKIDLNNLFHISGAELPADCGTRPDLLRAKDIGPNSEWILGKPWMRLSLEEAIKTGIVTRLKDINLQGEKKEDFKKGVSVDPGFEVINKGHNIVTMSQADQNKVSQRLAFSNYIFPPLKRKFTSVVRITSIVLTAVRMFKKLLIKAQIRKGLKTSDDLKVLNPPPVKFVAFPTIVGKDVEDKMKTVEKLKLRIFFNIEMDEAPTESAKEIASPDESDVKNYEMDITWSVCPQLKHFPTPKCRRRCEWEVIARRAIDPSYNIIKPVAEHLVEKDSEVYQQRIQDASNNFLAYSEMKLTEGSRTGFHVGSECFSNENSDPFWNLTRKGQSKADHVAGITIKRGSKQLRYQLSDEELSDGLDYLYKRATKELQEFFDKKELAKIGVVRDEVMFCKSRILEGQTVRSVENLSNELNLQSFTGVSFNVPLIDRFSPLAISIANHMHYNVTPHMGQETVYRFSLQNARILKGRSLFKEISEDCVKCKKMRKKYIEAMMGPLTDAQLSISPVFFDTIVDLWGPVRVFVPGYEKVTRGAIKEYKIWIMIFACAATGTVNLQVIEKKDTDAILTGLNRFFVDCTVPKMMYPDKEGSLMAAMQEGEINLVDLQGNLSAERGILFETCASQGHYAHGRVERKIGLLKEALSRSNIVQNRLHAMGWLTIAKLIERDVNALPIGFLTHTGKESSLSRILTPGMLKLNGMSNRAPSGVFQTPYRATELMDKISKTYSLWYKVWSIVYVPHMMDRQKWHVSAPNLKVGHIVYFKLTESKMSADWRVGRVEFVKVSDDEVVRTVGIAYKTEVGESFSIVERPSRAVIRLFHLEDTCLMDQMKSVEKYAEELLKSKLIVSGEELSTETDGPRADDVGDNSKDKPRNEKEKQASDDDEIFDTTIEELSQNREIVTISEESDEESEKVVKRRKTEVEKLKIENQEFQKPPKSRRAKVTTCSNQFCTAHWLATVELDCECAEMDIAGDNMKEIMDKVMMSLATKDEESLDLGFGAEELDFVLSADLDEGEKGFLI